MWQETFGVVRHTGQRVRQRGGAVTIWEWFAKFDYQGFAAGIVGSLIALGFIPKLTFQQAVTVLMTGMAVSVYLVPLALYYIGMSQDGPPARALGFIGGLLGMRIISVLMKWGDSVNSPADFLAPFRRKPPTDGAV